MASTMAMSRPKVGPRAQLATRMRKERRGGFLSFSVMVMISRRTTSHRINPVGFKPRSQPVRLGQYVTV
jgi:hypothetical protein